MLINIKATPNAKHAEIKKLSDMDYKAKIDAPALEGKANARLLEMLAEHFGVSKSQVRIVKGLGSRNKLAEIG